MLYNHVKVKTMLEEMLDMQYELNKQIHPQWDVQGYRWDTAIFVEVAELLEHYGWKWWKHQETDSDQVMLELVDIWHFILSKFMAFPPAGIRGTFSACKVILPQLEIYRPVGHSDSNKTSINFITVAKDLANGNGNIIHNFCDLCTHMNMSFDKLYGLYIGKNVLNRFRQENGYKEGTYRKEWNGIEDNVYLIKIIDLLSNSGELTPENIKKQLSITYSNTAVNHVSS